MNWIEFVRIENVIVVIIRLLARPESVNRDPIFSVLCSPLPRFHVHFFQIFSHKLYPLLSWATIYFLPPVCLPNKYMNAA